MARRSSTTRQSDRKEGDSLLADLHPLTSMRLGKTKRVRIDGNPCRKLLYNRLNRSRRSCCHVLRLASSFSRPPSFHKLGLSASIHLHRASASMYLGARYFLDKLQLVTRTLSRSWTGFKISM